MNHEQKDGLISFLNERMKTIEEFIVSDNFSRDQKLNVIESIAKASQRVIKDKRQSC